MQKTNLAQTFKVFVRKNEANQHEKVFVTFYSNNSNCLLKVHPLLCLKKIRG